MRMQGLRKTTESLDVRLSVEETASFRARGFITLPQISSEPELQLLRPIFKALFARRAGRDEGAHFDLVTHDDDDTISVLPTITNPVNYAPELRHLLFRRNSFAIARQLLGRSVTPAFEHAILKPAGRGAPTPWHQDEAYRVAPEFAYQQLSFWMPLDEATIENGCMHYIPKSNLGPVLPHHSFKDDPSIHAIECIGGFNASDACVCPLPAGGVAIHGGRTLHFSGPNQTNHPRYAYILAFEVPPKRLKMARDFYWNREKQTLNQRRRSQWRRRGGIVIEAVRKYRLGMLNSPERILFEVRRGVLAILAYLEFYR